MSLSSTATFSLALLVAFAQAAEARTCGYDYYGRYTCNGFSGGRIAWIVIVAVVPVILFLLFLGCCLRRRRRNRIANESYINQPQQQMYEQPAGTYGPGPQTYGQAQSYPQQNNYAPPAGAPPYQGNQYAAPVGPPPAAHTNGGSAASYYNRV